MTDKIYKKMMLRKRFCKRLLFMLITFSVCFYLTVLLFGDLKSPVILRLTDLDRCPACFGISICPELYSNQIALDSNSWTNIFNAKNVYYGYTKTNKRVVLKKLAHDWELKSFDSKLCEVWNKSRNCKPKELLNESNVEKQIIRSVQYNLTTPDTEPRKGLIICPYAYSVFDFIQPVFKSKNSNMKSDMINIWTMLNINPEPLILQVLLKSKGWPVPSWGGVCGRLEVVSNDGVSLSTLMDIVWHRKLLIAQKILNAAMDFTFKHDRFRFYLMDWSLDNIVVNEKDEVSFVDLEDVIVLDKFTSPGKDLPHWYKRYSKEATGPGFIFSIENMCRHHLSDHNLWAACYILAGEENPLLYPIPEHVNKSRPYFDKLFNKCLNNEDRFQTVSKLQQLISDMLNDEEIVGFGVIR